jgi:UDP-glucose 4-epimerase
MGVVIVRLFSIYGEGLRKQLMWDACSKAAKGEPLFSGTGGELRDWLHAADAAELLRLAAQYASPLCPIVNGGAGEGVAVREILKIIFDEYGTALSLSFSGEARVGDPAHYVAGICIAQGWGWAPRVNIKDGVKSYVRWFEGQVL